MEHALRHTPILWIALLSGVIPGYRFDSDGIWEFRNGNRAGVPTGLLNVDGHGYEHGRSLQTPCQLNENWQ